MRVGELSMSLAGAVLAAAAGAASAPPAAVSPGGSDRITSLRDGCPAFSWTQVEGARGYELVVYGLAAAEPGAASEELSDSEAGLVQAEPVLRQGLPGGALSWTPAVERCLASR